MTFIHFHMFFEHVRLRFHYGGVIIKNWFAVYVEKIGKRTEIKHFF